VADAAVEEVRLPLQQRQLLLQQRLPRRRQLLRQRRLPRQRRPEVEAVAAVEVVRRRAGPLRRPVLLQLRP